MTDVTALAGVIDIDAGIVGKTKVFQVDVNGAHKASSNHSRGVHQID